ncbi:hypothetical protein K4L44_04415 [Halosquirtibacter laminarini]|uniref:Uncharacterized protein n=1 Tax=Halosquirtibacter laminarini TaxID=3374600 RepID=A0AC61NNR5_9BACT|nr:hypothetical protein K4L44_04415 [Prolixibacteraceae bacterium]
MKRIEFIKRIVALREYQYLDVDILLTDSGKPICFHFNQDVSKEFEKLVSSNLKKLHFNAALKDKRYRASVFTINLW